MILKPFEYGALHNVFWFLRGVSSTVELDALAGIIVAFCCPALVMSVLAEFHMLACNVSELVVPVLAERENKMTTVK